MSSVEKTLKKTRAQKKTTRFYPRIWAQMRGLKRNAFFSMRVFFNGQTDQFDRRTEKTDECENKISQHDRKKGEKTNEKFNENR